MPEPLTSPRRHACLLAGTLLAAAAMGCGTLLASRSIEVPQARIEQWVAARLPYSTRLADAFDVFVAVPRLRLLPEANRVAADVAVSLDEPVLRLAWRGSDALLRDRAVHTLRPQDVQAMRARGQHLRELRVTASGLLITLVPNVPQSLP